MPVIIDDFFNEGESGWIDVAAEDVDGSAVTPTAMWYWWTDEDGVVINDREGEVVSSLADPTQIELTPDDTAISESDDQVRILTVKYTYNSARGNGKTRTEAAQTYIKALVAYP